MFVANGDRYNLLNSVVLELFDYIWREGIKSLTIYFADKLYPLVEDVSSTQPRFKDEMVRSAMLGEGGQGFTFP